MFPASETNNTAGVLSKIIFRDRAFAFRRAKLHARQEAAKILIAFAGFGEEWVTGTRYYSDFRADMRFNAGFLRSVMQARSAVDAITIEKCDCGHRVFPACSDKLLGQGSAFKKAECRVGMKFDVGRAQSKTPSAYQRSM